MNKLEFFLYLVFWYIFTLISVIYTKFYLNITNDSLTFTLVSFSYGFVIKVLSDHKNILEMFMDKKHLRNYLCLSLFNIGSLTLTNISINQTSVSFIYMIKASEPIFVLVLSYYLLGHTCDYKIFLILIQICLGVSFTIIGNPSKSNNSFMMYALVSVFFSNLSTASRSVFYKLSFQSESSDKFHSTKPSSYQLYFDVTFFSFLIVLPFYLAKLLIAILISSSSEKEMAFVFYQIITNLAIDDNQMKLLKYLFVGTLLNFAYNLFSFKVLENVTSITHSVMNIMKRMFIVFGSMFVFSTKLGSMQVIGILLADIGCLIYSYLRTKSTIQIKHVNSRLTSFISKLIVGLISLVLILTFLFEIQKNNISATTLDYEYDNTTFEIDNSIKNLNSELKIEKDRFYKKYKSGCIRKLRYEILSNFRELLPQRKRVALLELPDNDNYDDTIIW